MGAVKRAAEVAAKVIDRNGMMARLIASKEALRPKLGQVSNYVSLSLSLFLDRSIDFISPLMLSAFDSK